MTNSGLRIGIFDSGVGGLTIYQAVRSSLPSASFAYCSDNEFHPYGTKSDEAVANRTLDVCERFVAAAKLDLLVVACNTASTVALALLRSRLSLPVVGVVPAIKPAAAKSATGVIGLLATPATIRRQYVEELIQQFAGHCHVVRAGSSRLVELAEEKARGGDVAVAAIHVEIMPLFVEYPQVGKNLRLDTIVLGCTHFPLLLDELRAAAPWPVQWIDSGNAIASRVSQLIHESGSQLPASAPAGDSVAWVTRMDPAASLLAPMMRRFGFNSIRQLP